MSGCTNTIPQSEATATIFPAGSIKLAEDQLKDCLSHPSVSDERLIIKSI